MSTANQFTVPVSPITLPDGTIYSLRGLVPDNYLVATAPDPGQGSKLTDYDDVLISVYNLSAEAAFNIGYGSYFSFNVEGSLSYICYDLICYLQPVANTVSGSPIQNLHYGVGGRCLIKTIGVDSSKLEVAIGDLAPTIEANGGYAEFSFQVLGLGKSAFAQIAGLTAASVGGYTTATETYIGAFFNYLIDQHTNGDPTQWTPSLISVDLDFSVTGFPARTSAIGVFALQSIQNGDSLNTALNNWNTGIKAPNWQLPWLDSLGVPFITSVYGDFSLSGDSVPTAGDQGSAKAMLLVGS